MDTDTVVSGSAGSSGVGDGVHARLAVEVRYERGLRYFDRCGSLTQHLQDALGAAFYISAPPTIDHAELNNAVERIAVRFSPKSLIVAQTGPTTPARVEKIASVAWEWVQKTLELGGQVGRFGVRNTYFWPTSDLGAAQRLITRLGLAAPSPLWVTTFGQPDWSNIGAVTLDARGVSTRRAIDIIQHQIEGLLPPDMKPFVPAVALQFDVDCTYGASKNLGVAPVRDFIRSTWSSFQVDLKKLEDRLNTLT